MMNDWFLRVLAPVAAIMLISVAPQPPYAQGDCILQCTEDWIAAHADCWDRSFTTPNWSMVWAETSRQWQRGCRESKLTHGQPCRVSFSF